MSLGFVGSMLADHCNSHFISIIGVIRSGNKDACARKAKDLAAKYKAKLTKRETAAGPMVFEVRHSSAVEVELASTATKPSPTRLSPGVGVRRFKATCRTARIVENSHYPWQRHNGIMPNMTMLLERYADAP